MLYVIQGKIYKFDGILSLQNRDIGFGELLSGFDAMLQSDFVIKQDDCSCYEFVKDRISKSKITAMSWESAVRYMNKYYGNPSSRYCLDDVVINVSGIDDLKFLKE